MNNRLRDLIYRNSTGKTVLILFILTNLVYVFMLTVTIPQVMEFAEGMKLLDMIPTGYDAEYVNTLFTALGENGRHVYLCNQIPIDLIYPLLFAISNCLLFAFFLRKINRMESSFFYICLLPLISGVSDYIENIGIIIMLRQYPDFLLSTVSITNTFSILKSSSTSIYFVALIVVMVTYGVQYLKRQKTKGPTD